MRDRLNSLVDSLLPILATLAALAIGAVMLLLLRVNPITAYRALLEGAFGSTNAVAETLVKATPLLFVGLGICIAFRGAVINIGGEGQMVVGALLATVVGLTLTDWPGWLVVSLALLAGFVGGAIWGGIPGLLKAYFNVNEILSTIMMNAIAVQGMNFLLRGPMIDPAQAELASKIPQTARLIEAYRLPRLVPTRLHLGALIAVILAILVYILLWRTTLGYRIRAVGQNPHASRYAGISVKRHVVMALLLSGAFAGLAGATQVYGVNYRMITDGSATGFTGTIRTLALSVKANIVPDEHKASEAAPDYRVFSGTVELGAGWKRTTKNGEQREYVSVKLDDPSFPAAIYANLVQTEGDPSVYSLIWSR